MSIASEVFNRTSEAQKSYRENKKEWDQIFAANRQRLKIRFRLEEVKHLIPKEYDYYSQGYLNFFAELGFSVSLPGRLAWYAENIKVITLSR